MHGDGGHEKWAAFVETFAGRSIRAIKGRRPPHSRHVIAHSCRLSSAMSAIQELVVVVLI